MIRIHDACRRARRAAALAAILSVGFGLALTVGAQVDQRAAAESHMRAQSGQAFRQTATVLTHPRCLNCHTSVDYPKQGDDRHRHQFRVARDSDGRGVAAMTCSTCHQAINNSASGAPGAPNWHLAPPSMAWEDLPVRELFRTLKEVSKNGGRSMPALVEHLTGDPLVQWAWSPGAERRPPPVEQGKFHDLVRAWAASGAICPR